ncbi:MAG: NrtA/SsuA/CpmA family ABC transporter substrate-binding protein [Nitrospirae bacterium]|nr:NrtA/SsuA/CpmA family ABC transporter substrate-binding protein [Nitrospirota bacterium]
MNSRPYYFVLLLAVFIVFFYQNVVTAGDQVKLGGPKNISMAAIVAEKEGYFRSEGLNVESSNIQTGKVAMDALLSGNIDFAIIVDTNIAFVKFQPGSDIEIICSIGTKFDDGIVARKDKGIQSIKDLKGKTVAVTTGTTNHIFAYRLLAQNGLEKDVKFMNLTPPAIQASLLTGDIAAGSIWEPFRYNVMKQLNSNAVEFVDPNAYKAYAIVAVRKKYAEEHGQEIVKFLNALIRGEEFIRKHRDEAIGILAHEMDMDKNVLKAIWKEYDVSVMLEPGMLQTIKSEGKWIKETQRGFDDRPVPSYDDVVNPAFLKKIAPQRVILK